MEIKNHYKMFKAGKLWVTALVSVAVLGTAGVAHAAAQQPTVTTGSVPAVASLPSSVETPAGNVQRTPGTSQPGPATSSADDSSATTVKTAQPAVQTPVATTANTAADQQQSSATNQNQRIQDQRATAQPTVSNPGNYPTEAAALVGQNAQGQPYYIFQIVNLYKTTVNDQPARMILAVDPVNPQGTCYVYVTNDQYDRQYVTAYTVRSNSYRDITISGRTYRVYNTAPRNINFNGKSITVPASLSISSNNSSIRPEYGLGNQNSIAYTNKVDITPERNSPAIEYLYRDQDGNYVPNKSGFPQNVSIDGLTGQVVKIPNVNNYMHVLTGYYLTNYPNGLANDGTSYRGVISQFQLGKYYAKTLYDWDSHAVSETLIYELINPDGTMNISLLRPDQPTETLEVPVGSYKQFSNKTYARNPYVPGMSSVQLVYADLGHIIPVDQNNNPIAGAPQPIYNNDLNDAHKAAATDSPDLTAQDWVLANPAQATIDPVDPGADTLVQYVKAVRTTETRQVTQTVQYQYADGTTEGRPALPKDNVQTLTFTRTTVTNPIDDTVISDTGWTPAQQFTAVTTPPISGFFADQDSAGGETVTWDTPNQTYVVSYLGPRQDTETKTITQTVDYAYADGITAGRPALPAPDTQQLTFTRTITRNPQTEEVLSDTWSGPQRFTIVTTPPVDGYYANLAAAGSNDEVTHESADVVYHVLYAAPNVATREKEVTQTVRYQYQDGETQGRPTLPADNFQRVTFDETVTTQPFTGAVISSIWRPDTHLFTLVKTPRIEGFYADKPEAGSDQPFNHEAVSSFYVVNYAAPIRTVTESKTVTQTIRYEYADGITAGRPGLPATNVQTLVFNRIELTNPFTHELISDTWTPAQQFTVIQTPTIAGFVPDQSQAGSNALINYDSPNLEFVVQYALPQPEPTEPVTPERPTAPTTPGIPARPAQPSNPVGPAGVAARGQANSTTRHQLPQTGNEENKAGVIGLALAALTGVLGTRRKRRQD